MTSGATTNQASYGLKPDLFSSEVPLAPFTTFGVGGEARLLIEAHSEKDVSEALTFARAHELPLFVLGGGSNVLISDSGFAGVVLLMRIGGIELEPISKHTCEPANRKMVVGLGLAAPGERVLKVIQKRRAEDRDHVTVGAGVVWDEFVTWAIEQKYAGLECLSGVPGTVGGAVVANLGAYGAEMSDTFVQAEVLDTRDPSGVKIFRKEECEFSYHDSLFGRANGRYIVLRATFALSKDPAAQPSYRDNRFDMTKLTAELGRPPTQQEVRDAVLAMREEKGSLIMPGRVSYKCAGSFFHMPFVSPEKLEQVRAKARSLDAGREEHLRPWSWEQKDGSHKVAPGFLLEYTEFRKGYVRGGAGVSPRHTLSLINARDARAEEIAELARDMRDAVETIFGIRLEREVEYVGDIKYK